MLFALLFFQSVIFSFPIEQIESLENIFQISKFSQSEIILVEFETGQITKINLKEKKYTIYSNQSQDYQSVAAFYCDIDMNSYIYYNFSREITKINQNFEELYSIPLLENITSISSIITKQNRLILFDTSENQFIIYDLPLNRVIHDKKTDHNITLNIESPSRLVQTEKYLLLLDRNSIHFFDFFAHYIFSKNFGINFEDSKLSSIKQFAKKDDIQWVLFNNHYLYRNNKIISKNIIDFIVYNNFILALDTHFDFIRINL